MNLAQYTFLPWVRQGISKDINQEDTLGGEVGVKDRATVTVSLRLEGMPVGRTAYEPITEPAEAGAPSGKPVYKDVQIIGPGDITGVKAEAIVRTEPYPNVGNFEPNYFPYIEFYEEDFPWRYTPASEKQGKLRPWLVLVVLKESEFERRFLPGAPLPAITHGPSDIAFPPRDETWAWAHVQANRNFPSGTEVEELQKLVDENPNLASSRLICPRRLEANTRYTAFLLPAFEQGRLAGLGASEEDISKQDIQLPSWGEGTGNLFPGLWPVYYEWDFQTSDLADFEYLVRRIEARVIEDPIGRRPMDMQAAGYELSYTEQDGVLRVEGALQIIDADKDRVDFLNQEEATPFIEGLQEMLNLNDPPESGEGTPASVDQALYTNEAADDPIVTPPLYGQWHAGKTRVEEGGSKPWFRELNLDPRNRVAAGFGTLVVRKNQDAYMDRAWEQAADILEAQRQIRLARFSAETARRLQRSYFDKMDAPTYAAFSSSMHGRALFSEQNAVGQIVRRRVIQTDDQEEAVADQQEERTRLLDQLDALKEELQTILQDIENKEEEIQEKQSEIDELSVEIEALQQQIDDLTIEIQEKQGEMDAKQGVIDGLTAEIEALDEDLKNETDQNEIDNLEQQIEDKKRQKEDEEELWEDLKAEKEGLEEQQTEKEAELGIKRDQKEAADAALIFLNGQLSALETKESNLREDIIKKESEISNVENEIQRLSLLYLPTSTLRQDYRKLARVNSPLLRRSDVSQAASDPVSEISSEVDNLVRNADAPNAEKVAVDWESLNWGADTFKRFEAEALLDIATAPYTTPSLVETPLKQFSQAYRGLNQRLREIMSVKTEAINIPAVETRTRPLIAYPEFREATYEALANISSELMLPNVQLIPMDTFSLLEVNQRFIESYLVGLNHEMARELLWREFPTDQRGSYFRSFWDDTDNLETTYPPPDIELLTKMAEPLGQNIPEGRPIPPPNPEDPHVVFVIRSELLKKFPNALVYIQKAGKVTAPRGLTTHTDFEHRRMPIFQAKINPEISFFGFPISATEAMGSETDPGWFFVVQERPGEPRFGLDITAEQEGSTIDTIGEWNDLAWTHLGTEPGQFLRVSGDVQPPLPLPPESGSPSKYTWGYNSAHMAGILLQLPFRAAVHATDMLKIPKTDA